MGAGSSAQRKLSEEKPAEEEELVLNDCVCIDVRCVMLTALLTFVAAISNRMLELKIETGDQNAVKNMLDDAIAEYFQEKDEFTIHYGWDNVKLLLMVFATAIAAVSHFYKSPVISERVLIYSSVGGFFFIHALLLGYSVFVEKDTILRMSKKGSKTPVMLVRTDFPYTEENYTICVQHEGQAEKQVKVELYVGRFFDSEGYFHKDAFIKDLETVVSRFQKVKKQ